MSEPGDRDRMDFGVDEKFRGDHPAQDRGEAAWIALMDARFSLQKAGDLLWVMAHRGEPVAGVQPRQLLHELAGQVVTLAGLVERAGVKGG